MGDVGLQPAMHVASVPVGHGTGDGVVGDVAVGDGAVGDGTVGDVVDITGEGDRRAGDGVAVALVVLLLIMIS
jgi:hypothetical protein